MHSAAVPLDTVGTLSQFIHSAVSSAALRQIRMALALFLASARRVHLYAIARDPDWAVLDVRQGSRSQWRSFRESRGGQNRAGGGPRLNRHGDST